MGAFVTLNEQSLKHLLETCHNCSKGNAAQVWMGNLSESVGREAVHLFSFLCCETVISAEGVTWHCEDAALESTAGRALSCLHPAPVTQDPADGEELKQFVEISVKSEECVKSVVDEDDGSCKVVLEKDPLLLEESPVLPASRGECASEGHTQDCDAKAANKSLRKNLVGILGQQDVLGGNVMNKSNTFPGNTKGNKYPETFTCEFCGKIFQGKERAYQFYYHRNREHTHEMTFKCDVCFKEFWGDRELLAHRVQHRDQGHVCHVCGQKFNAKKNLNVHLLVHAPSREHVCGYCGKAFRRKDHLTVHERIHTGVRPYQCQWCDSGYPQRHQLKLHIRKCPVLKQSEAKLCAT
ncbi:Zinc finger protein 300 [Chionoecetes opilio]|uniref:Zinc finger protein 300 n=1 Tax=Chionoecetes opilio TaxID=41210 RepID=A0A8J8WMY7_CHIOP|nr:Zinc finger protein 300 [Chionoecetes opilio]